MYKCLFSGIQCGGGQCSPGESHQPWQQQEGGSEGPGKGG